MLATRRCSLRLATLSHQFGCFSRPPCLCHYAPRPSSEAPNITPKFKCFHIKRVRCLETWNPSPRRSSTPFGCSLVSISECALICLRWCETDGEGGVALYALEKTNKGPSARERESEREREAVGSIWGAEGRQNSRKGWRVELQGRATKEREHSQSATVLRDSHDLQQCWATSQMPLGCPWCRLPAASLRQPWELSSVPPVAWRSRATAPPQVGPWGRVASLP